MAQRKDNLFIRVWRRSRAEIGLIPDRWQSLGRFSRVTDAKKPILLVNSIPKSGTHLVGKLAEMLGFHDLRIHLLDGQYWDYNRKGNLHKWDALSGYETFANPRLIRQPLDRALSRMGRGQFARAHINWTERTRAAIQKASIKHVFIFRDPRDIVVSYVQHVTNRPDRNPLPAAHEYFSGALHDDHQRIDATIQGVSGVQPDMLEFIFNGKVEWLDDPETCCIRFEDLVGQRGGGTGERQREAISRILSYLGIQPSDTLHEQLANELHGGQTHTFNTGQIGGWREAFSADNIQRFKETAGDLLFRLGYETDDNW